jgi:hypothetical protein
MRTDKELREIVDRAGWMDQSKPEPGDEEIGAVLGELIPAEQKRLAAVMREDQERRITPHMAALGETARTAIMRQWAQLDQLQAELRDLLEEEDPPEDGPAS